MFFVRSTTNSVVTHITTGVIKIACGALCRPKAPFIKTMKAANANDDRFFINGLILLYRYEVIGSGYTPRFHLANIYWLQANFIGRTGYKPARWG